MSVRTASYAESIHLRLLPTSFVKNHHSWVQLHPRLSRPQRKKNCKSEFDNCLVVLGRDWLWIANVPGYTGPKGVHFCRDCL